MRNAFAKALTETAAARDDVVLLSGDIGNRLFDPFKERCPDRFINCGVAEANMIGVAAGMAMSGLRPVAYTIVPFLTSRCLEQIRVDLCYQRQPVVLVGVGGGLSYASLGGTHHACEDIALLRALPEMSVLCPGDALEVPGALAAALAHDGPVYVRLGKKGEAVVHDAEPEVALGGSITVRSGDDVALLAVGNLLPLACEAAADLEREGIGARVESMVSVKPLDEGMLEEVFATCRAVVVVEEHSRIGGAGAAVAQWSVDRREPVRARLACVATPDAFFHEAGSQAYARERLGLTPQAVATAAREAMAAR